MILLSRQTLTRKKFSTIKLHAYSMRVIFLLAFAENDVFKKTISILRPGYTPPTRKSIAGGLLDKIYIEVTTMAASALEGKEVTLLQDGWNCPLCAYWRKIILSEFC